MSGSYQGWAVLEVFGYRKHLGLVSEVTQYGATMLRIEALGDTFDGPRTVHFYPGSSVFALKPITEEDARRSFEPYRPIAQLPTRAEDADFDDPSKVVRIHGVAGWALKDLSKDEPEIFVAFFAGPDGNPLAQCAGSVSEKDDAGRDRKIVGEPAIFPAFLSREEGLVIADDTNGDGIATLSERFGVPASEWIESADEDDAPDSVDPSELTNTDEEPGF